MVYFFGIIIIVLLYTVYVQIKVRLQYLLIIYSISKKLNKAVSIMREVDKNGAFLAHDEVGETFFLLTTTILELRNYFTELVENGKKKK